MMGNAALLRACPSDADRLQLLFKLVPPRVDRTAALFKEDAYAYFAIAYCASTTAQSADAAKLALAAISCLRQDVLRLRAAEAFVRAGVDLAPVTREILAPYTDDFYLGEVRKLLALAALDSAKKQRKTVAAACAAKAHDFGGPGAAKAAQKEPMPPPGDAESIRGDVLVPAAPPVLPSADLESLWPILEEGGSPEPPSDGDSDAGYNSDAEQEEIPAMLIPSWMLEDMSCVSLSGDDGT